MLYVVVITIIMVAAGMSVVEVLKLFCTLSWIRTTIIIVVVGVQGGHANNG